MFTPGTRVRLRHSVDRYPHFLAPMGATGTVVVSEEQIFAVKMDETLEGCEEWDNEIVWYEDDLQNVTEALEVIGE